MQPLTVTLVQNSAGSQLSANLAAIEDQLSHTPPSDLIILPELFMLRGSQTDQSDHAEVIPGPVTQWMATMATRYECWIMAGLIEREGDSIYNTCLLLDPRGHEISRYRKIHLFDADLGPGQHVDERKFYTAGSSPVVATVNGWRIGLSICYDLRFPELYRHYAAQQVDIITVPANFTRITGEAHWETLLRARAIENQCYVLAPNQCGTHPASNVESYGNTMAIDPWGNILQRLNNAEACTQVTLTQDLIIKTRQSLPVHRHRKL